MRAYLEMSIKFAKHLDKRSMLEISGVGEHFIISILSSGHDEAPGQGAQGPAPALQALGRRPPGEAGARAGARGRSAGGEDRIEFLK